MTVFPRRVRAFAPASIGNLGPGLDVLGCAVTGAGDTVIAEWCDDISDSGIVLRDPGHPELPTDPHAHSSAIAAADVLRQALGGSTRAPAAAIALTVKKDLPLSAGQGGSAASAVAGAVAVNALCGSPLGTEALLEACLLAESTVAGRHLDNLAPSLLGGICLVLGIFPRWAALANVPAMLGAIVFVHLKNGFWADLKPDSPGYEYVLVLLVATVASAMIGGGALGLRR